jgi:hypothetical protein
MFRRLAREAVIFMLLGMVLAAVGSFIYLRHDIAYWTAEIAKYGGTVVAPATISETAVTAAVFGLYGFIGGFGVWLFYRLVRFAVKG